MGTLSKLRPSIPVPCKTWTLGDSLTAGGTGGTVVGWPQQIASPKTILNLAVGGYETWQVIEQLTGTTFGGPMLSGQGYPRPTRVIMLVGINDLANSRSENTTFGWKDTIVASLTAAGIDYRWVTLLPLPEGNSGSWSLDTGRLSHNARLATQYPGKVIDVESAMGNGASPNRLPTGYSYGDNVHMNNTGQAALAALLDPYVLT